MHRAILSSPEFEVFPDLIHGFTTKERGSDYDRIASDLKILPSQIYYLEQIHSNKVICLERDTDLGDLPPADALVTDRRDIIIGVRTADCVPILLYDSHSRVIAAIHAGHKGLRGGIIQRTIRLMTERLACHEETMHSLIGPCISVDHYEVGLELIDQFRKEMGQRFVSNQQGGKYYLNLLETTKLVLGDLELNPEQIHESGLCTYTDNKLLYSHRREPSQGRQFNFIGMF